MKQEITARLANVGLRGASMASKFILIFVLAKLFSVEDVGVYGLFIATLSFGVLLIGADFYTYSQRELLARPREEWGNVVQQQVKAQLILYLVLVPPLIIIFVFGLLDWRWFYWFIALLFVEHIAQEVNRLLIAMHMQVLASIVLFIRMGIWVLILIPLIWYFPDLRSLEVVLVFWLTAGLVATLVGVFIIKNKIKNWTPQTLNVDWIKKGIFVGFLFFVGTLSFKFVLTADKYFIESMSSLEVLGAYVFFLSLAMGIPAFLEPAVFSFLYPKMLESYQHHNKQSFIKYYRELFWSTLLVGLVLGVLLWYLTPFLLDWLDKDIYKSFFNDFYVLILVGFVYSLSHVPHYALYAMKSDRWIVFSHVSSVFVFVLFIVLYHSESVIAQIGFGLLSAFSWMLLVKTLGYFSSKRKSALLNGNINDSLW